VERKPRREEPRERREKSGDENIVYGLRPVIEAIETDKQIEKLYVKKGAEGQLMADLKDLCYRSRIRYQEVPVEKLNRLTRGNHQGVVAVIAPIAYVELEDILDRVPEDEQALIVVFDGVTDVRNFGAIARSAECAGAHGIISSLKNSAPVNADSIRSSAGALTRIPVARVGSIRNTLKSLQAEGFQVVAATEHSRKLMYDADLTKPTVIVMGSEENGISKEVLKLCDEQLAIPMIGAIESLNVSAAAAIMLFEVVRQRIG
jgi:23S rRNA (guanosine2251-2'-O)-methyltransferase